MISPFSVLYGNYSLESIQNFLIKCHFIELSRFFSILSVLWIFCSGLAKYHLYSTCFVTIIKVVLDSALLSKYSSNIFLILGLNKEKEGYEGIVLLNMRLVES